MLSFRVVPLEREIQHNLDFANFCKETMCRVTYQIQATEDANCMTPKGYFKAKEEMCDDINCWKRRFKKDFPDELIDFNENSERNECNKQR